MLSLIVVVVVVVMMAVVVVVVVVVVVAVILVDVVADRGSRCRGNDGSRGSRGCGSVGCGWGPRGCESVGCGWGPFDAFHHKLRGAEAPCRQGPQHHAHVAVDGDAGLP